MDAGALNQSILIEARSVTFDAFGAEVEGWSPHSTPWAKVTETPGREFLKGEYLAEHKAVFQVRWRQLDTTARVTWGGRVYDITAITGTRKDGWTYLHCIARAN